MFIFEIKNLLKFLFLEKNKKQFVFYSESLFYKNFYIDFFLELKKLEPNSLIITSDINEYNYHKEKNIEIFYIGKGLVRLFFFNLINCNFFIMTMTDIGNNFRKSRFCGNYVYYFHSLASTHMIYNSKAFDNFDIVLTNGDYQKKEIIYNEKINKLKSKKILNTGYFYLDYLRHKINSNLTSNNTILFAPSWNKNDKNLFNDHGERIVNLLCQNGYKVILRPHPEIFERNKKKVKKIQDLFKNSDLFEIDKKSSNIESMEKSFVLITDNSTIAMEFGLALKKPVVYIDYSKKIHNENYKTINTVPIEEVFKKTIGNTINISEIDSLPNLLDNLKKNHNLSEDILEDFEKKNLSNVGNSALAAAKYLSNIQ